MNENGISGLLSDDNLHAALRRVVKHGDATDKLDWWIRSPHSIERWFQFEFAYALNTLIGAEYHVACERHRIDIVIYHREVWESLSWKAEHIASIELKVRGNWYAQNLGYILGQLTKDVDKIQDSKFGTPASALCIWVFAKPKAIQDPRLRWLSEIVGPNGKGGFEDIQDVETRLVKHGVDVVQIGEPIKCNAETCDFTIYLFGNTKMGMSNPVE